MCFHDPYSPKACREQNVFPETHAVWTHRVSSQPQAVGWALFYREKVAFLVTFYGIIKASSSLCPPWGFFGLLFGAFVSRPLRPFLLPGAVAFLSLQDSAFFLICLVLAACGPDDALAHTGWWILICLLFPFISFSSYHFSLEAWDTVWLVVTILWLFSSHHQNSNMLWVLTNCILHNAKLQFVISIFFFFFHQTLFWLSRLLALSLGTK